jgi:hypothetical protein
MICDILASIEIGVRADLALRFVSWQEILASPKMPASTRATPNPLAIPASISYVSPRAGTMEQWDKPLVPDALFGLEYSTDGRRTYRFFALEADRNTEPVVRGNLHQTSYLRKILQYREIAARRTYLAHLGVPNLFVLNVTTNEQHMNNIMRFVTDATEGNGSSYLLFKTMPSLASLEKAPPPTPCLLTEAWYRAGHPDLPIDRP